MATTMTFLTVDTLQFSKRLQKAGLDKKISEELAEAIKDMHVQSLEGLATKNNISLLKKDISMIKKDIQTLEYKLTVKMLLMLTVAVGMITWLDKVIK